MRIQQYVPCRALAPHVHSFYEIQHDLPVDVSMNVSFGCTGRSHFVFCLQSPFQCLDNDGAPMDICESTLFTQISRPYTKNFCGPTLGLTIDFTPSGLYALWPMPAQAMSERSYDLTAVITRDTRDLTDQLRNTPSTAQRFAVLEMFLLRQLARAKRTDGRIEAAVRAIQQRPGHVDFGQLAWQLNCSERTLRRRFTEQVGHSPKYHARIQRFLHTWRWLKRDTSPHWHDLIQAGGYYDQAHLINEFRHFSGGSPLRYETGATGLHDSLRES
ncbi:MAG: AraC family transcriptional regulator [Bacteroidetes bacterium]|nr:AraC family transcriptional regulator [Fibrella sp.]